MTPLPARVLVDLPNWLGDFVHALPALASVLRANTGGETWALLPAAHVPLARLLGVRVLGRPRGAGFHFGTGLRGRFDVVITARHSTRAKLLLAGIGAPVRLASRGRGAAVLGLSTFPVLRSCHQRHDLDLALRALGIPAEGEEPFLLPLPSTLAAQGRRLKSLLADGSPTVALLPAARGGNGKRYPLEKFSSVAKALAAAGVTPVVVVGPGEEELAAGLAGPVGAGVAPTEWALDETAALLAACDAAVGNDSGLTHLAAAVGCPTVALFGPTDPTRTAPVGRATVLCARSSDVAGQLVRLDHAEVTGTIVAVLSARRRVARRREGSERAPEEPQRRQANRS